MMNRESALRQVLRFADLQFYPKTPDELILAFTTAFDKEYQAEQFTKDYEVKVDAHSTSPIFIEDHKADAFEYLKAKVITRSRFIKMVGAPEEQLLLEELKGIEAQEAKAAELQMKMEQQKHAKQ